ncbi:P-loop containing nucleoside triphosphate hydrolase protein [Mycena latifolia]|nr:P-loop containing nucleoside triphosphate hydrolase protein [Mycena latifolia]
MNFTAILTLASSNSLSLLPSESKIFHGRESEVSTIIKQFSKEIPRVVILGAGGMGKTSLARAILHHPEITDRYNQHRVFVACDTATSSIQLAALIGVYLGLNPGKDFTQPVIHHFRNNPPSLLILDNLETVWEPRESRTEVEKFLCMLADINHLAIIITMRGAERPANVQWSHPFLGPLKPLTQEAARETFLDIVDSGYSLEDIDKVLSLTDNMPLAIDLIAHAVDYEGASSVLNRWETEKTALLSEGYDKGSNLDSSILLSLESSRLTSLPQSRDLLSLLSMLPDGLADADLMQSNLPLENILACKVALLQTSLAYTDDKQRLRVLVPIREFVKARYPPGAQLVQAVIQHFFFLLEIHESYHGTISSHGLVTRIGSNFSNIGNILMHSLNQTDIDRVNIIYFICHFDRFSRQTKHGRSQLIYEIPNLMPRRRDHRLEVYFIIQLLGGHLYHPVPNAPNLVAQALECLPHFDDTALKCRFHIYLHLVKY